MSLQPPRDKRASLADAVSLVGDDATVALGGGLSARLPMAMVRELVRQGRRGLHLVGSAHSIDVDLLVGGGCGAPVRGKLCRLRAGSRPGPGVPPGRRGRHHRGRGELLRHDPGPAAGGGDGPAVPAGARSARLGHWPAAPRVRGDHLPVHRGAAGRGARAAAGRGPAARARRGPVRQPAPGPAVCPGRAVRRRVPAGHRDRGRAGGHGRGGGHGRRRSPGTWWPRW